MKRYILALSVFILLVTSQMVSGQSRFSLMPGFFCNGSLLKDEVNGFGGTVGLEYRSRENHFFSLELRTKYVYYFFNDGTKWTTDKDGLPVPPNREEARLEYSLFTPQVGLVPKFHFHWDESLSFFLENDVSIGWMSGNFKYQGARKEKRFTEFLFIYNIGAGVEYKLGKYAFVGSVGYSTLNFREKIKKHQPANYQGRIPNQDALLWISLIFKIPLYKR